MVRKNFECAVSALFGGLAFDHGDEGAVVDSVDECVVVGVRVALEHGGDFAGALEDFADGSGVANGVGAVGVESLVGKDENGFVGAGEVALEPSDFLGRDGCVFPIEVISSVGGSVGGEAGVEEDEVEGALIEGGVGLGVTARVVDELFFGE